MKSIAFLFTFGLKPATVSNLCTEKTPIGNAEVRTLVTLVQLVGCTLDKLIIYRDGTRYEALEI